jgi:hypothetical protein
MTFGLVATSYLSKIAGLKECFTKGVMTAKGTQEVLKSAFIALEDAATEAATMKERIAVLGKEKEALAWRVENLKAREMELKKRLRKGRE